MIVSEFCLVLSSFAKSLMELHQDAVELREYNVGHADERWMTIAHKMYAGSQNMHDVAVVLEAWTLESDTHEEERKAGESPEDRNGLPVRPPEGGEDTVRG